MTTQRQRAGNLPAEATKLIGRRSELAQLQRLFEGSRLVTLTGVGGVGKTRLALRAAVEAQQGLRDGAWWVGLSPLGQPALLPYAIAEVLPLADQTTRPVIDVVADYLADRELLLVLDTCEHLTDACAMAAQVLLRAAPGLRILATSRRPLNLPGEQVLTVDPLPVPETADAAADDADAVTLLAERAAEAVPGFTVTDANRADVLSLCRRLEGLPLALELAATRLREMPVQELTKRLEDRYAVLGDTDDGTIDTGDAVTDTDDATTDAEPPPGPWHPSPRHRYLPDSRRRSSEGTPLSSESPPWHRALRTAIGWSHQLCTPLERLLWARLSVFAGTFDADAAGQVCGDGRIPAEQVPALLGALADKSILTWVPTGGGERYRMLDTIRAYGADWLRRLGEENRLRRRHRDHYLALAHQADTAWAGPDQVVWHDRMTGERANFRAALDFSFAEGEGHTALEMSGALWPLWYACGFAKEGQHHLDRALALEQPPGPARAKALWARGLVAIPQGDTRTSLRLAGVFRDALAGETDETALVAAAYLEGASLTASGRHERAAEVLDAAPHPRPGHGRYDAALFVARVARAFVHLQLGQSAQAAAVAEDVCAKCARSGETWARSWGNYVRALAALGRGRPEEAAAHARTALDGKHRLHDTIGIAVVTDLLASAVVASGRAEQAARLLGIAEQVWRTIGTSQMGSPELMAARQACEAQARRLIGDDAYTTAFHAGRDTDPDTGIAYALNPTEPY